MFAADLGLAFRLAKPHLWAYSPDAPHHVVGRDLERAATAWNGEGGEVRLTPHFPTNLIR